METHLDPAIVAAVQRAVDDARNGAIERWSKRPPNAPLFLLCQHLMSLPHAAGMRPDDLLPYVAMFWDAAAEYCSNGTLDAEDAENAFVVLWCSGKVREARSNRLEVARQYAANGSIPPAEAARYSTAGMRQLVHVCYLLAKAHGQGRFFLSGADAAEIIGKQPRSGLLALKRLCADGILRMTEKGNSLSGKASEYAYISSNTAS